MHPTIHGKGPNSLATRQPTNQLLDQRLAAATDLLRPLLNQDGGQQGASYFRALSKLHKHFPGMTQAELEAMAVMVIRSLNGR